MEEKRTANAETNTDPLKSINIINTDKKKKPHNITIKNFNPNEPKVYPNMKYTEKQKYRRYKTKTEPKLYSKIMIDEEDDIISTIKKAFGIEKENKRNFSNVETSGVDYVKDPEPIEVEQTKPPKYITQPNEDEDYDMEAVYAEFMKLLDEKPPKQKISIATEITNVVAAPIPKTPKERAEELNRLSEEFEKEINEIIDENEPDVLIQKRLFRGLRTQREKEDAWDKYLYDKKVDEERKEYKRITKGLNTADATDAWRKHKKDKEDEFHKNRLEALDKYLEEEHHKKRLETLNKRRKEKIKTTLMKYKR